MLFYCVQTFDLSGKLLLQIQNNYPHIYKKVEKFEKKVFLNLRSYYEVGKDIGVFKEDLNPMLLALDDRQFFEMLSNSELMQENNIEVLEAFSQHFRMKFMGVIQTIN